MNRALIVYKITCLITMKCYIGITSRSLKERWDSHCCTNYCPKLSKAIKKYGKENFIIEEIDGANSLSELNYKEQHWIYKLNTIEDGYNVLKGGRYNPSEKTGKTKTKRVSKTCFTSESVTGDKNPFYGKKHSKESIEIANHKKWEWRQTDAYQEFLEKRRNNPKLKEISSKTLKKARSNPDWKKNLLKSRGFSPILVFNVDGSFVGKFEIRLDFYKKYNLSGSLGDYYLRNRRYKFKDFYIKFENDEISFEEMVIKANTPYDRKKIKNQQVINLTTGKIFEDRYSAAESIGSPIGSMTQVLTGKIHSLKGYVFEYIDHPRKEEFRKKRESLNVRQTKLVKCLESGNIYKSIREASRKLGIGKSAIKNNLYGLSKTAGGRSFIYV